MVAAKMLSLRITLWNLSSGVVSNKQAARTGCCLVASPVSTSADKVWIMTFLTSGNFPRPRWTWICKAELFVSWPRCTLTKLMHDLPKNRSVSGEQVRSALLH